MAERPDLADVESLRARAEDATDAYKRALEAESGRYADWQHARQTALAHCDESWSEAKKERHGDAAAVEEKIALHHAEQRVKAKYADKETALAVLSAGQSYLRAVEKQT